MAFIGLIVACKDIICWIFAFICEKENFAIMEIGSLFIMAIIQGLLCYGIVKRRSGFLTCWLFVSFIGIIALAVNFGYVSLICVSFINFLVIIYEFQYKGQEEINFLNPKF